MTHKKIIIAGSGRIGSALGLILRELNPEPLDLFIGDADAGIARATADWITGGSSAKGSVEPFTMHTESPDKPMERLMKEADIILDCLPGSAAPQVAQLALDHDLHYANLTEHIQETKAIQLMAKNAGKGFVLQSGLAPGFVNVLANHLYREFSALTGQKKVDYIGMKVGALTPHSHAPHFYGFTWSSIGVATEYVKPAEVIRDYEKTTKDALSERRWLILDGISYSEDLTSGGAADLPDAFEGIAENLDYKTLRYPGHYRFIEGLLAKVTNTSDKANELHRLMVEQIPFVDDDMVIIYACVRGKDKSGKMLLKEKYYKIEPVSIGEKKLSAIQATTAASLAEVSAMLLTDQYHGVIGQSQLDPEAFLNGNFTSRIYRWDIV